MMKKLILSILCTVMSIGLLTAQTTRVTGTVISAEDGQPVIGATVIVKGTSIGNITNYDGEFSLDAPASATTLVVSYIGMKSQEVAIRPNVRVELQVESQLLDEIVVTGYGNFKKSSFTGAASTVATEKLENVPTINFEDRLAGNVSGVMVTSTSGQPGAMGDIRIRGMGSINANKNPLYVIDGVPVTSGNINSFSYDQAGMSMLSNINSNDIESMTVIKDAAAASLYGSRAANGVIVITTKKGKAGKTNFTARANWGFTDMAIDYRPTLNGEDRRELLHLGLVNNRLNANLSEAEAKAYADANIDRFASKPWSGYTDWKDILFRTGSQENYELSAQGGSEKTKFYSSLAYTRNEGVTISSAFERFTGTANVTHVADRITIEARTMFSHSNQSVNNENTSFASPIMAIAMTASPSTFPYNEDGTYSTVFPALNGANPLQTANLNYNRNGTNKTTVSLSLTWNIWDNLNLKEVIAYDYTNIESDVWWDPRSNDGRTAKGVFQRYAKNYNKLNTQTQLSYNKTFATKHNFDALLGFETEDYKYNYTYANGQNYPYYLEEIENAGTTRAASSYRQYRLSSLLGLINYNYDNRYYLSANIRRDGTSRLSEDTRWGNFWSVSGSWRFSQESFMESIAHIITDAKLRASYGVNGTWPNNFYDYMGLFSFGWNYNGLGGSQEERLSNESLKWEKNYATNIGLDFTLFDRLSITAEWYNRDTKDLIMNKGISGTIGVNTPGTVGGRRLLNVGSLRNRGFEFEIKSNNIQNANIDWTTSLTLAHNKNKLLVLDGEQTREINGRRISEIGKPYYSIYGVEYAGVDPETGKESYYTNKLDANGNRSRDITTKIAEAESINLGKTEADIVGGLSNFFRWKFIDLNLTFTYSLGGKVYSNASWIQSDGGSYHYNGHIPAYYNIDDTWKQPGDNAKLPQFAYGNVFNHSSRWLWSTDHLRLKNLTLGFTVPRQWTQKAGLTRVRAYASGQNIFTIKAKELQVDPETRVDGLAVMETPQTRTITFGIEIGF